MADKRPTVTNIHNQAMDIPEQALVGRLYKRDGLHNRRLFREALGYERAALAAMTSKVQPSWSVLCRSAGALALDCGEFDQAVELAHMGLTDDCDGVIREEIMDLLNAVAWRRRERARIQRASGRFRHMNGGGVYGRRRRGRGN